MGIGPVTWLLVSEVFPLGLRAKAISLATVANRLTSGTVALTFLSMKNAFGGALVFFVYMIISVFTVIYFYYYVPETQNKTLEEMTAYFEQITRTRSIRRVPLTEMMTADLKLFSDNTQVNVTQEEDSRPSL